MRGIDVANPASPDLGPIVPTGLGQIGAVAVQGATAAAGQLIGGQVVFVDLSAAIVRATVPTSLASVGSVAFCTPTLVLASGPSDVCVAVIDFSASPPSVSYLFPGLGSDLTVAGDSGLAAVGAVASGSPVTLFDPVSGWQQGWGAVPGGASSVGLSGTSVMYGTAAGTVAYLADIPTANLTGPAGIGVTSTPFSAGVGSGAIVSCAGTDGACGGASTSAVTLFDLSASPPTLLGSTASGLPGIGSIAVASFTDTGGPASAAWMPAELAFGAVVTGTTGTLTLSITNSGGTALKAAIESGSMPTFTVSASDLWIPPGQTYAIQVSFDPASPASFAGSLSMQTSDPSHTAVSIPMSGSGSQPAGHATWTYTPSLPFGNVPLGMTQTMNVSITNSGQVDLGVTGIVSNAACWTADLGSLTVHPGQTGTVQVSFHPSAATSYTGELTFQTSDPMRPDGIVSLSGSGQEPAGRATWAPGGIDFGNVNFGATGSNALTIANTGSGDLGVTNLSWPPNCTPSEAGPFTVAQGQTLELGVNFTAPSDGTYSWSGTLTFDTTDPARAAVEIPLSAELGAVGCFPSSLVKAGQAVRAAAGRIRQAGHR